MESKPPSLWPRLVAGLLAATLVIMVAGAFTLREDERAVVTRLGRPVRTLLEPGLHFRLPWPLESVHRLDARLQFTETRLSEALTRDKRNVVIPLFVAWRVEDPLRFLQAVGPLSAAPARLDALATSARNAALGEVDFHTLVSADADQLGRFAETEERIRASLAATARATLGIAVLQTGFKRLSLPEANTESVFRRMIAERAQYAARYRADGRRQAEQIRSETDARRTVLLAEARQYAEETRGKAEAEAAGIYAQAHAQDPEFYAFTRELQTLRQVAGKNTTLVLDAAAPPFRLLLPTAAAPAKP